MCLRGVFFLPLSPICNNGKIFMNENIANGSTPERPLDDITLQRIYEGRRLCLTKLDNIKESLDRKSVV